MSTSIKKKSGIRFEQLTLEQESFRYIICAQSPLQKSLIISFSICLLIASGLFAGIFGGILGRMLFVYTKSVVNAGLLLTPCAFVVTLIWISSFVRKSISVGLSRALIATLISVFITIAFSHSYDFLQLPIFYNLLCIIVISISLMCYLFMNLVLENLVFEKPKYILFVSFVSLISVSIASSYLMRDPIPPKFIFSGIYFGYFLIILGISSALLVVYSTNKAAQNLSNTSLSFLKNWTDSLTSWGGCSFYGLDLSGLDFSGSNLSYSDFRGCTWHRTILRGVKGLNCSQIDNNYLDLHLPKVQKLLTDCEVGDKNFRGICLRGAYLQGVDLQGVDFTDADLRGADLRGANLTDCWLIDARLVDADLTGAILTGACIKGSGLEGSRAQNISLQDVTCSDIYLGFERGEKRERREFAPGEFEQFCAGSSKSPVHSLTPQTYARKLLFLATNPRGTTELTLTQEYRDIRDAWERWRYQGTFEIEPYLAARRDDVRRALLSFKPHIVHFAGHGDGEEGLVFENESGQPEWFPTQALSNLFQSFSNHLDCVVLNACYSDVQAKAIGQHIDYVIGMTQAIPDAAARAFSRGFYDALFANESIEQAFNLGLNSIEIEGSDSRSRSRKLIGISNPDSSLKPIVSADLLPILKKRPGVQTDPIDYIGPVWTRIVPESTNRDKLHHIMIRCGEKKWEGQKIIPEQGIVLCYNKREQQPWHRSVRVLPPDLAAYPNAILSVSDATEITSGYLNPPESAQKEEITLA